MELKILSAGAVRSLFASIEQAFRLETGLEVRGEFGAVGGMQNRILGGETADAIVLTRANIEKCVNNGIVIPESVRDVGNVRTAIAVRNDGPPCDVSNAEALRSALLGSDGIYFPDPEKATAGIHFVKVLSELGIANIVRDRWRLSPDGRTAMNAMAIGGDLNPIGCTQVTEILDTPGIRHVASLPNGYDLTTTYTAAVLTLSKSKKFAATFVSMITSAENSVLREKAGFS